MHRYWASGLDIYALNHPIVIHDDAGDSYLSETRLDHRPEDRVKYPHAEAIHWRLQRFGHRVADSVLKRAAFPGYLRQGRNEGLESSIGEIRRQKVVLHQALRPHAWSR
jgi:hypothetical protein